MSHKKKMDIIASVMIMYLASCIFLHQTPNYMVIAISCLLVIELQQEIRRKHKQDHKSEDSNNL